MCPCTGAACAIFLNSLVLSVMNPMQNHYDAIIIGAGPAGETAAKRLAGAGRRTLVRSLRS